MEGSFKQGKVVHFKKIYSLKHLVSEQLPGRKLDVYVIMYIFIIKLAKSSHHSPYWFGYCSLSLDNFPSLLENRVVFMERIFIECSHDKQFAKLNIFQKRILSDILNQFLALLTCGTNQEA